MPDNSMGTIKATISLTPFATLTPHTEEELMTAYRDRLDAGDYAGDGPEHENVEAPEAPDDQPDEESGEADDDEESAEDVAATKAANARAAELGVDLASVQGTGLNGKVTVPDVEAAYEAMAAAQ